MQRSPFYILLAMALLFCAAAPAADGLPGVYANPVSETSLPDPTVIRGPDGLFYLYATEDTRNVPIFRSSDLVEWRQVGTVFTAGTRPTFLENGHVWAPDITRIGERYVLYYTLSLWGEEWKNGIGAAVADSPEGPFRDMGKLFTSAGIGVQNSIDQCYVADRGKNYLFWGSFRGLYAIELAADGLSVKEDAEKVPIAGTLYEAAYVHRREGYYYLFASIGTCCEGVKSTYTTVVGRSRSLLGPYVNKAGERMLDNRHEVVIAGNDRFAGPGHNATLVTDAAGDDWILYHAVDRNDPRGRKLMLDRVQWVDGWPVVGEGTPSLEARTPLF